MNAIHPRRRPARIGLGFISRTDDTHQIASGSYLSQRVSQASALLYRAASAASAAWPRRHPYRRTSPSSCTASLPKRRACAPDRRSSRQPCAPSSPNDLLFREPCSRHLSVLRRAGTLTPCGEKTQWQVRAPGPKYGPVPADETCRIGGCRRRRPHGEETEMADIGTKSRYPSPRRSRCR
jgi:hypothetical protein